MTPRETDFLVAKLRQTFEFVGAGVLLGNLSGDIGPVQSYDRDAVLAWLDIGSISGVGTVSSVGLSMPGIFSVSGSPVSTTGTLTATLVNQSAGAVLAGPTTGSPAVPSFRALVDTDIPTLTSAKISDFTTAARAAFSAGSGIQITAGSIAVTTHVHSAADITSGTLSAGRLPALGGDLASSAGSAVVTVNRTQRLILADADTEDSVPGVRAVVNTAGSVNFPGSAGAGIQVLRHTVAASTLGSFQLWSGLDATEDFYWKKKVTDSTWTAWRKVWHDGNFDPATKEGAFSKGTLAVGAGLSLSGSGASRLVSAGTLTISLSSHSHLIADVTGLQGALDGKASAVHTHPWADITGTPTTRAGYGITDAADLATFNAHVALSTAHGISAFGSTLVGAASDATARSTLGLGTASVKNAPAFGDAGAGEVVLGSDSRLTDNRTPVAHGHPAADITDATAWTRAFLGVGDQNEALVALGLVQGEGSEPTFVPIDSPAQYAVSANGGGASTRHKLNLVAGSGIGINLVDDPVGDETTVTIQGNSHTHDASDVVSGVLPQSRLVGAYPSVTGVGTLTALTVTGLSSLKATQGGLSSGYFACWLSDPTTSGNTLYWRSAAQVLSDIGGAGLYHGHAAEDVTSGTLNSARLSGSYSGVTGLGTLTSLTVSGSVAFTGLGADLSNGAGYLPVVRASSGGSMRSMTISGFKGLIDVQIGDVLGLSGVLDNKVSTSRSVTGALSLSGGGALTDDIVLNLDGDQETPGGDRYYGTNAGGVKGWYSLPPGSLATLANVGDHSSTVYGKKTVRFVSNNGTIAIAVSSVSADEVEVNLQIAEI